MFHGAGLGPAGRGASANRTKKCACIHVTKVPVLPCSIRNKRTMHSRRHLDHAYQCLYQIHLRSFLEACSFGRTCGLFRIMSNCNNLHPRKFWKIDGFVQETTDLPSLCTLASDANGTPGESQCQCQMRIRDWAGKVECYQSALEARETKPRSISR